MNRLSARLLALAALAVTAPGCWSSKSTEGPPPPEVSPAVKKEVVEGNTAFALDLYGRLREQKGNLFFSPYSISSALAMTYAGARQHTQEEMAKVLHFPKDQTHLHPAFARLNWELMGGGKGQGCQLNIANALWGQKDKKFRDDFRQLTRDHYGAGLKEVDFSSDHEGARRTINGWVEKETNDKIKELLKPRDVDSDTLLVLTNAIYFKGDWANKFDKNRANDEAFWVAPDRKATVPLMRQNAEFKYTEADGVQILEMPYKGGELSMVVLLPRQRDGLAELEKTLKAVRLSVWLATLSKTQVDVALPKFKTTCGFELADVLKTMGMSDAFTRGVADFSGLDDTKVLFISNVIHKAFVEVHEEGSEAAAATAIKYKDKDRGPDRTSAVVFRADHPFLFLIRDTRSGSILFLGRLINPAE
jgi:serpin B